MKRTEQEPQLANPFIGIDQSGNSYRLGKHPRKDLLEQLGRKSAQKMYQDIGGVAYHIGYIIAGYWIHIMGLEGNIFATEA